ncbi:MAG TPA: HNH endonuclease signature motif containing protein, partial [Trebonia sp.]|nr:HNH endonuclease signature motif containing protein [Trebonia sp.]
HSGRDGPDARQAAALADLLRDLNVTFTPIAKGGCDHRNAEDRYTPSRQLKHLVWARTATCPAPGCGAQAVHCDLDHTLPYPAGITCQCDLAPPCRRHHRVKQAPGWTLTQPEPGIMHWQAPSGRSYTTTPTVYDA